MDASASLPPAPDTRLATARREELAHPELKLPEKPKAQPAAEAAMRIAASQEAEMKAALAPAKLLIEIDKVSGRFVNTLIDPNTQNVVLQYPNDTQLAFSRAVAAYVRAQSERGGG